MKIDRKNFNSFYIEKIQSKIVLLEQSRKKTVKTFFVIVGITLAISSMLGFSTVKTINIFSMLIVLTPVCVVGGITYYFTFRKFRRLYKDKIIHLLFQNIFDDFFYRPDSYLNEADYQSTLLYQGNYNRYSGEDFVEGQFRGQDVKFSELLVRKVEHRKKKSSTKIIFNGLMILIKVRTPFVSQTTVEPDITEKYFGHVGRALQSNQKGFLELVRLESPDFEKNFVVYSTDQIEVRKFLTPMTQEKLTEFKMQSDMQFAFSIQPNLISIALPNLRNQFEPNYFSRLDNVKVVREIIDLFLFLDELILQIKLKTD